MARAICASSGDDPDMVFTGFEDPAWMEWVDNAKPAIRAVLAHFAEAGNINEEMIQALRTEVIKGYYATKPRLIASYQVAIAAAMAAALKEMESE